MRLPPDGVADAPLHDLDPEAVLDRDSRVLLEPTFLKALHRELLLDKPHRLDGRHHLLGNCVIGRVAS